MIALHVNIVFRNLGLQFGPRHDVMTPAFLGRLQYQKGVNNQTIPTLKTHFSNYIAANCPCLVNVFHRVY